MAIIKRKPYDVDLDPNLSNEELLALRNKRNVGIVEGELKQIIENRNIPSETHVCPICKRELGSVNFFKVNSNKTWGWKDDQNTYRVQYCRECTNNIFNLLFITDLKKNKRLAIYKTCALLNIYYDEECCQKMLKEKITFEDGKDIPTNMGFFEIYERILEEKQESEKDPKAFWSSLTKSDDYDLDRVAIGQQSVFALSDQAKSDRSRIMQVFHCDPFLDETPEDKEGMYSDLVTMI